MAAQGGAQAAAEAARVAELGRQLYEASERGEAAKVAPLGLGGADRAQRREYSEDAAHDCCSQWTHRGCDPAGQSRR